MQTARKGLRIGKSMNEFKKATDIWKAPENGGKDTRPVWRKAVQTIIHCGMFTFFYCDNLKFFNAIKLFDHYDARSVNGRAGLAWWVVKCFSVFVCAPWDYLQLCKKELAAIAEGRRRDTHHGGEEGGGHFIEQRPAVRKGGDEVVEETGAEKKVREVREKKFLTLITAVKDFCDMTVASNSPWLRIAERITGKKLHDGKLMVRVVGRLRQQPWYDVWPLSCGFLPLVVASCG